MKEIETVRHAKWLLTVVLAALCATGCGSGRRARQDELAGQIDKARRLHRHAIALLANPVYVDKRTGLTYPTLETVVQADGSSYPARVTRTEGGYRIQRLDGSVRELPAEAVSRIAPAKPTENDIELPSLQPPLGTGTVTSQPAEQRGRRALDKLDEARQVLLDALSAHADAPVGLKGDAELLLGQVELTRAQYRGFQAEQLRLVAGDHRRMSISLLGAASNEGILAELHRRLANLPRDKIQAMVQETSKRAAGLSAKIDAAKTEIGNIRKTADDLARQNEAKRAEARKLRDGSSVAHGREGLDLLVKAQQIEAEIRAKDSSISKGKDRIASLQVDQALLRKELDGLNGTLKGLADRLDEMDKSGSDAKQAMDKAAASAGQQFALATEAAKRAVGVSERLAEEEKAALEALKKAGEHLDRAVSSARTERQQAEGVETKQKATAEILEGLRGHEHLASVLAQRASASAAAGDIQRSRLGTAGDNARLAKAMEDVAKKLAEDPPEVCGQLRTTYLAKPSEAETAAEKAYDAAEKDLNEVLKMPLRNDPTGRNILWMYEGQLAGVYYGHYQLKGDPKVLVSARTFLQQALEGREASGYLDAVKRLRDLVASAGGAGQP